MKKDTIIINDLGDFFFQIYNSETESKISDIIDATPDVFKNLMQIFVIEELPPLSLRSLRVQIRKKTGDIIRFILKDEQAIREAESFNDWLDTIPLIPEITKSKLKDNYRRACMRYENFSDCHSGFVQAQELLSTWMKNSFFI
ncbi:MAG: hypothetical protein V3574_03340 [Candidatus Moraniibacteriota bacterium]